MFKQKLMEKLAKKGKELDPNEQKAKVGVIKELSFQAGSMMGDKMKGLKKGLSDEDESLEHPAEDSLADHTGSPAKGGASDGDSSPEEGSAEEEALESPEMEAKEQDDDMESHEDADCSPEELDEKIKDLLKLKAHKESKKY